MPVNVNTLKQNMANNRKYYMAVAQRCTKSEYTLK